MQHSEYLAANEQWHSQQGDDALLAKDGVHDVSVVDPFDHHRRALGCNPSGEPLSYGNPDSSLDLFFNTLGSSGNELVGAFIEQEYGSRIRPENFPDTDQELIQEVLR